MFLLFSLLACTKGVTPEVVMPEAHPLDTRPTIGNVTDYAPPTPEVLTLDNGVPVWFLHQPGLPLISVRLIVEGGKASDPTDKPGVVSFTDSMMTRGAGEMDSTAFSAAVEDAALSLYLSTGERRSWVTLDAHSDQFTKGLELMMSAITAPRFDKDEFERAQEQRKAELAQSLDDPRTLAGWIAQELYFGESHPLAHASIGSKEAIIATTTDDLKQSWSSRFGPSNTQVVVVGDIEKEAALDALNTALGSWQDSKVVTKPAETTPPTGAAGYYLVNNTGAAQSVLRVMVPGWEETDADYPKASLGSIVLGGTFTSRLNRLLREEKGYTYGARASLSTGDGYGKLVTSSNVRTDVTGPALADMLSELERLTSDGIDDVEIKKAKGSKKTRVVGSMGQRGEVANNYAGYAASGRGPGDLGANLLATQRATLEEVNTVLQGINLDDKIVLVVGDLAEIEAQVRDSVPADWVVLDR